MTNPRRPVARNAIGDVVYIETLRNGLTVPGVEAAELFYRSQPDPYAGMRRRNTEFETVRKERK